MKKYILKKLNEEAEMNRKRYIKCFTCGQWGHISKNCEEAKYQNNAKTAVDLKTNIVLLEDEEE